MPQVRMCWLQPLSFPLRCPQMPIEPSIGSSDEEDVEDLPPTKKLKLSCDPPVTPAASDVTLHETTGRCAPSHGAHPFDSRRRMSSILSTRRARMPASPTPHASINPPVLNYLKVPPAIQALSSSVSVPLSTQLPVIAHFFETHKSFCVVHTLLGHPSVYPHKARVQCDLLAPSSDLEYKTFRSAFRSVYNPGRCPSCGCPKTENMQHQGNWARSEDCKDDELQDWIIGLALYIWKFQHLRQYVLPLLGLSENLFVTPDENSMDNFAKWLGLRSGRDVTSVSSHLLDFLFVIAQNTQEVFSLVRLPLDCKSIEDIE